MREIDRLTLRADLVVLSACNSADGKATGDSVLGFSSAFRAAGVPSVLVALWSIPDAPTAQLMRSFYAGLRQGRDKAGALQAAMLQTMKANPHPANWAAFELIGDNAALPGFDTIKGNSPASPPDTGAPELLLPSEFSDYQQSAARAGAGPSAMFRSPLSMAELLAFYRDAYGKKGLTEERALTLLDARSANLVMVGPGGQRLVVQLSQWDDPTGGADAYRFVSIRFEPENPRP